jgi:hypothetical protein
MTNLLVNFIHKILLIKRKIILNSKRSNKHALISYVLFPPVPFDFDFFFNVSHNRYLKSYLMAKVLKKLGYIVHIYDYNNLEINYKFNYKIFIGHNFTFNLIAKNLQPECKKILLTTGSSPQFDNLQLEKRQEDLNNRLKCSDNFYKPIINYNYVLENIKAADIFFMIGNKNISDTWNIDPTKYIYHYNNVNKIKFRKKLNRTNNFIYLSSIGQLRRGLDLIVDTFKNRSEIIYICGNYEEELFMKYYSNIIKSAPNIRLMGYVNQTSNKFLEIVDNSDFAILPSCSEGQSGSILTLMSFGLLPVITDQVGFLDINNYGYRIDNLKLHTIENLVEKCVNESEIVIDQKREFLLTQSKLYTTDSFTNNLEKMLIKNT